MASGFESPDFSKDNEVIASTKREGAGGGRRRRLEIPEGTPPLALLSPLQQSSSPSPRFSSYHFEGGVLLGLSVAGVASSLLATSFALFHVDVFLRAYELPLSTYSTGSFVFGIVNTINDLVAAWIVDHYAMSQSRSDLVGLSTCLLAIGFLAPFFRWKKPITLLDGLHFVLSTTVYDTLFSFTTILIASVVSDNHLMSDTARVQFMASGKLANLLASWAAARLGLAVFDIENLEPFRIFVVLLSLIVILLAIAAQTMISGTSRKRGYRCCHLLPVGRHLHDEDEQDMNLSQAKLRFWQIAHDFWTHSNFMAFVGMETLLEAQTTFVSNFAKTFVDNLMTGFSQNTCDWILSSIRPMTNVVSILAYYPIQRMGYPRVYTLLFRFNLLLSLLVLSIVNVRDGDHSFWVALFLCIYPVITGAVQSAGFALAQADMVLEMKRRHLFSDRHDEPSLAGLFMGANALFCKPVQSILTTVAATVLSQTNESRESLFHLLVVPPLIFSCLQLLAWSRFDLTPARTAKMREELRKMHRMESP